MPKAILKSGVIYPLEPLPPEWTEGTELWVEPVLANGTGEKEVGGENSRERVPSPEAIDRWFQELEAMVANNDPRDIEKLEAALKEADEQAKAMMKREMGLP